MKEVSLQERIDDMAKLISLQKDYIVQCEEHIGLLKQTVEIRDKQLVVLNKHIEELDGFIGKSMAQTDAAILAAEKIFLMK